MPQRMPPLNALKAFEATAGDVVDDKTMHGFLWRMGKIAAETGSREKLDQVYRDVPRDNLEAMAYFRNLRLLAKKYPTHAGDVYREYAQACVDGTVTEVRMTDACKELMAADDLKNARKYVSSIENPSSRCYQILALADEYAIRGKQQQSAELLREFEAALDRVERLTTKTLLMQRRDLLLKLRKQLEDWMERTGDHALEAMRVRQGFHTGKIKCFLRREASDNIPSQLDERIGSFPVSIINEFGNFVFAFSDATP